MAHSHSIYDSDPHFTIDAVTRAITNQSNKTILMQYDHDSERFSFEINRLVEGHDVTLCNKVEIHYTNTDGNRQGVNYGVYEVTDMVVDSENEDRVVFTWLVSQNATMYAGSLSFIIVFACVEGDEVVYRWNTNINNSVSIAVGMNNGEAVEEKYPDILAQWKDQLFAAATGTNSVVVGPIEPDNYPYIWFDTSEYLGTTEKNVGYLTIKPADGVKQRLYPVVKMDSIEGLKAALDKIISDHEYDMDLFVDVILGEIQDRTDADNELSIRIDDLEKVLTGAEVAIAHSLTTKGVAVPDNMSIQDVAALIDIIEMDIPTALQSIEVTTPPNKTEYYPSQAFDATGMVVTANFGDGVTVPVECYTVSPTTMTEGTTQIEVSLTVNGVTKTTTYPVSVSLVIAATLPAGSLISVAESTLTNAWYRVVDTNYLDNVLLVREECLNESIKYRTSAPYDTGEHKYEGTKLDSYLNSTFYESLPSETIAVIQSVSIPVRSDATTEPDQAYLERYVFALSAKEWGFNTSSCEGEPVEYTSSLIANTAYWTREPSNGMNNMAYIIGTDGSCKSAYCTTSSNTPYPRPAFCISKTQGLKQIEGGWSIADNPADDLFATMVVDTYGNATISGIAFNVDSDGNATIG